MIALGFVFAYMTSAQAADLDNGKKVWKKCRACHVLGKKGGKLGPPLNGVVGRAAGTHADYTKYSDAMKNSGITWDEANLGEYLADPKAKIPGNKMVFAGIKDEAARGDLIAYIATFGADGMQAGQ